MNPFTNAETAARMTKNPIIIAILLILTTCSLPARAGQPMVIVKGAITGAVAPGSLDLVFTDESGAKVRSSSNTDGRYQAVLKSGHRYSVLITDQDLQRFTMTYETPASEKSAELTHDFVIRPAAPVATEPAGKASKKKTKTKKSTKR
ncbi:MAG: hypothetical protein ACKOBV_04615 [Candidatus Kapaibacterium sp.]